MHLPPAPHPVSFSGFTVWPSAPLPSLRLWLAAATTAALAAVALLPSAAHAQASAQAATRPAAPAARAPVAPVVVPDVPLTAEELALADGVHVGDLACELGQNVKLHADPGAPGHFLLQTRDGQFRMRPVRTSTGAVRLEDRQQGAVWIQLANKSMLMSQKLGRRLADECAGPAQRAVAEAMKLNPPPHLLDLGLNR